MEVKELEFGYYHFRHAECQNRQYNQTTVFYNDTVMSLLEGIFAVSTLPNFEFYMRDLRLCTRFIVSTWAAREAIWLAQQLEYLYSYLHVH